MTLIHVVDRCWLHRPVWFETVEGLAIKAHPFFCKGYDLNLFVKG